MPSQFEKYRFTKRTVLSDETFNRIWQDIDLRLVALEDIKKDWQGAVDIVTRHGLVRIEEVLRPSWEYIEQKKAQADTIVGEIQTLRNNADAIINANRDSVVNLINSVKENALNAIADSRSESLSVISSSRTSALAEITTSKAEALESINSLRVTALAEIEQARQQAVSQLDINKLYAMTFFFGGE